MLLEVNEWPSGKVKIDPNQHLIDIYEGRITNILLDRHKT
jgi:hypothetical protein